MPEGFPQTKITADPSKFSLRDEGLNIKLKGKERTFPVVVGAAGKEGDIYIDEEIDQKFHKIYSLVPSQKLLSLILKGVINVSDIVKFEDGYYSHEQNFDHIEPSTEDIIAEVIADLFITRRVFEDFDHEYYPKDFLDRTRIEKARPNSVLEHHNLRVDEVNNKSNIFDFESGGKNWLYMVEMKNPKCIKKIFKREFAKKLFSSDLQRNMALDILKKKINRLIGLFSNFVAFKQILQRSEVQLTEDEQQVIFSNIISRLQILNKELSK